MEAIEKAIQVLRNPDSGWATRKETAHALAESARKVIHALRDHKDDRDQDVRAAVRECLRKIPQVKAAPGAAPRKDYALEELAQHCAKPGSRTVHEYDEGYRVEVRIDEARMQDVFVRPITKDDGTQMIRVFTVCGKPDASTAAWALRTNTDMIGCAFAVENHERFEHLILVQNFHRAKASPEEVLAAVKQVAFYGDWLEKRLGTVDNF